METVMLVDDEDVVLDVGALMLRKLNYKVLKARTGKEARRVYEDNKDIVSLVILDIKLPDESGIETCKNLKEINPEVKVFHSSGLVIRGGNEVFECGCNQYLSKPFNLTELSAKIQEVLEEIGYVTN